MGAKRSYTHEQAVLAKALFDGGIRRSDIMRRLKLSRDVLERLLFPEKIRALQNASKKRCRAQIREYQRKCAAAKKAAGEHNYWHRRCSICDLTFNLNNLKYENHGRRVNFKTGWICQECADELFGKAGAVV